MVVDNLWKCVCPFVRKKWHRSKVGHCRQPADGEHSFLHRARPGDRHEMCRTQVRLARQRKLCCGVDVQKRANTTGKRQKLYRNRSFPLLLVNAKAMQSVTEAPTARQYEQFCVEKKKSKKKKTEYRKGKIKDTNKPIRMLVR